MPIPLAISSGIFSFETPRNGDKRKIPAIDATAHTNARRKVVSKSNPVTNAPIIEIEKIASTAKIWELRQIRSTIRLV